VLVSHRGGGKKCPQNHAHSAQRPTTSHFGHIYALSLLQPCFNNNNNKREKREQSQKAEAIEISKANEYNTVLNTLPGRPRTKHHTSRSWAYCTYQVLNTYKNTSTVLAILPPHKRTDHRSQITDNRSRIHTDCIEYKFQVHRSKSKRMVDKPKGLIPPRRRIFSRNRRFWFPVCFLILFTSTTRWMFPPTLSALSALSELNTPAPRICRTLQTKKLGSLVKQNDSKMIVIVVGLESSGSKLLTQLILKLAFPPTIERDGSHSNPKLSVPSGHGTYAHCRPNNSPAHCFGVMHLSLPYYDCFPDPTAEVAELRANGFHTRVILATRDQSTSLRSKLVDHQRDIVAARTEQQIATKMLASLMTTTGRDEPLVFSYETLMLLQSPYVERLAQALNLTLPQSAGNSDLLEELGLHLKDGNPKWMTLQAAIWSWLVRAARILGFGSRDPAVL
jgi:hypothetical protein